MGRDRGGLSEGQGGVIRRFRKASPSRAPCGANNQVTFQPVEIAQKFPIPKDKEKANKKAIGDQQSQKQNVFY